MLILNREEVCNMDITDMELIGSGAEADVYVWGNKAVKLFKHGRDVTTVRYEAELQSKAQGAGLPVPMIYNTCEIDGRAAIIMEHVKGRTVGETMLENIDKTSYYLELSVDMQIAIHEVDADGFPSQKEKLRENIMATQYLKDDQKHDLVRNLQDLESGGRLCHGDFHVLNLLQSSDGIKIIDWVAASRGSIASDVGRSYLLYLLYRPAIAEVYLDIYCNKSGLSKQEVLTWMPVLAGARLNENVTAADIELLLHIVNSKRAS
jgi:aminoglycoside phosphotransferase (APT) family kinase protein